jgi:YesN/AraC family two-component response regulator
VVESVERMFAYANEQFGLHPTAAWGSWVDDPLRLYVSYDEAKAYSRYSYFIEERRLFPHSEFSVRELSRDELPEHLSESFKEALRNRDIEAVKKALTVLVVQMETGCYAAGHCHEKWKDWVNLIRQYVKDMNLKSNEVVGEELLDRFQRIGGIRDFQEWLIDAVSRTFRYLEERERNRGSETIERVKAFVEDNLGRDLSLQVVAELVHLHPRYLSQLFKEETGVNFVDYVNRRRLETAAQLIKSSDLNVEQIAGSVGFNTPAYFIKKFKEMYGVTPKSYKINYTLNRPGQ